MNNNSNNTSIWWRQIEVFKIVLNSKDKWYKKKENEEEDEEEEEKKKKEKKKKKNKNKKKEKEKEKKKKKTKKKKERKKKKKKKKKLFTESLYDSCRKLMYIELTYLLTYLLVKIF